MVLRIHMPNQDQDPTSVSSFKHGQDGSVGSLGSNARRPDAEDRSPPNSRGQSRGEKHSERRKYKACRAALGTCRYRLAFLIIVRNADGRDIREQVAISNMIV